MTARNKQIRGERVRRSPRRNPARPLSQHDLEVVGRLWRKGFDAADVEWEEISDLSLFHPSGKAPTIGLKPSLTFRGRVDGYPVLLAMVSAPLPEAQWPGTRRIGISHNSVDDIATSWSWWETLLLRLRGDRLFLEVFPQFNQVVNQASMRWFWELPVGAELRLDLAGGVLRG